MTDTTPILDYETHERKPPNQVGTRILISVIVIMVAILATMEVKARQDNYRTSYPLIDDL